MAQQDVQSFQPITDAFLQYLNSYTELATGEIVHFGDGQQTEGMALYPMSGGVVVARLEDILGNLTNQCQYPATLIYKSVTGSEKVRKNIKEFLDAYGMWAEENWNDYDFDLADGLKVTNIARQTPAFLDSVEENGTQNWAIHLTLFYDHKYSQEE